MLASLLPGLRDLRTPLATGYLWLVVIWLLTHNRLPMTMQQAPAALKPLYQLGSILGATAVLTALSFIAYVTGSLLAFKVSWSYKAYILPAEDVFEGENWNTRNPLPNLSWTVRRARQWRAPWVLKLLRRSTFTGRRQEVLYRQLLTAIRPRFREAYKILSNSDHFNILSPRVTVVLPEFGLLPEDNKWNPSPEEAFWMRTYVAAVAQELDLVGIQLQTTSKELWDTVDRKDAESDFRAAISLPILTGTIILSWQGSPFWLIFLIVPIALLFLAIRLRTETAATLVQAVVLNLSIPPVLAELRDVEGQRIEQLKAEEESARPAKEKRGERRTASFGTSAEEH
jgi:hypothetical protein